jgi:hypothetical protein
MFGLIFNQLCCAFIQQTDARAVMKAVAVGAFFFAISRMIYTHPERKRNIDRFQTFPHLLPSNLSINLTILVASAAAAA